jgi:hypothetical protein
MNYNFNWNFVSGGAPFVTISALGLAFNSVAISALGCPEKIMVGFDEANLVIGVRAYDGTASIKPYEFASRIKNGWIRIGCRDFIKYLQRLLEADFSESKKYTAVFDAESNALVVRLRDEEHENK